MLTRFGRTAIITAVVATAGLGAAEAASANDSTLSCWTRGAYLSDAGTFGHKAVCNDQHAAVVTLKRDGVPVASYTSVARTVSAAGNHIGISSRAFDVRCGARYQVLVQVYPQPIAVAGDRVAASQYWTSGTPRVLCRPVDSSTSAPPGS